LLQAIMVSYLTSCLYVVPICDHADSVMLLDF
jgi:hypothetical protein